MFNNCTTSKKQGDAGIGSAIAYFTLKGYTVSLPLTDSQEYDLVVDINGLKKIQIKTSTTPSKYGGYTVNLHTCGGGNRNNVIKFDSTKSDFVYILVSNGDRYLIPTNHISATDAIIVGGKKYNEFKICAHGV